MADIKIPVKKLSDSEGFYYPLSTLESVVSTSGITVKNSVGGYRPSDVIPAKTTLKAILVKILTETGEADAVIHLSNIDVDELSKYATRIPASPLVAECLEKYLKKGKDYTDEEVEKVRKKLVKAVHYRGSVDYYRDLPTDTAEVGDIYNVRYRDDGSEDGNNYIFDADNRIWDKLSGFVDLSGFYTKTEINELLNALRNHVDDADRDLQDQITQVKIDYVRKDEACANLDAEEGKCITGIVQTNGVLTSVTSKKLSTDVSVTPILTEGTPIATIKVDDNTSTLYAPKGSSAVLETWRDKYNWYRLYSDGWIEQGGMATPSKKSKSLIIPFHKKMEDSYCSVQLTLDDSTGSDSCIPYKKIHNQSRIVVSWTFDLTPRFQWECKGYTSYTPTVYYVLTFNANGGTCGEESREVVSGEPIGPLPEASLPEFIFVGWFDSAVGGTIYSASSSVTKNTTLYAHWSGQGSSDLICIEGDYNTLISTEDGENNILTVKSYETDKKTVIFNPNGGTCSETSRKVTVNTEIGTLPIPTYANKQFAGWLTPSGIIVSKSTIITDDITLNASWKDSTIVNILSTETTSDHIYTEDKNNNIKL